MAKSRKSSVAGGRSRATNGRTIEIKPRAAASSSNPSSNGREISFIAKKDVRVGGRNYRAGDQIPARYARALTKGEPHADPAWGSTYSPPNSGRMVFPHMFTFGSRQSLISKIYRNPDQALQHSVENARAMRNDCLVMECLEARQRGTALLDWHLETEDKNNPHHKQLIEELTRMVSAIPRFTEYRRNLLEALWYGRYAVQHQWGFVHREGKRFTTIKNWLPINGDKLLFRYDDTSGMYDPDQVGIRTNFQHPKADRVAGSRQIELTDQGPGYFLEKWERRLLAIHRHMIEDGTYEDIMSAGRIHGVGIRDRIYWTWYQKQEALAMMMELVERTGNGFTIYYYQYGNPESEAKVAEVARNQSTNNVILMPRMSGDPSMDPYGIEQIPPNTAGIDALRELVNDFFGHQIKRYILGQILTSESAATGLGSGVADLHLESFLQIIKYDSRSLEETITVDTVQAIKDFNPEFNWARDIPVFFRIDTESTEPERKLQAAKTAWDMGARIKASDVMSMIGLSMPTEEDEVLQNPQFAPGMDMGMDGMGMPGMDGLGMDGELDDEFDGDGGDEFGQGGDEAGDFDPENPEHLFGDALKVAQSGGRAGGDGASASDGFPPGRKGAAKKRFSQASNRSRGRRIARYRIQHAPQGGATVGGKKFRGGEFIPDEAMANASPEELAKLRAGARQDKRESGMQKAGVFDAKTAPSRGESFALAKQALPGAPKIVQGAMVTLHRLTETQRDGLIHTDKFDQNSARVIFDWFAKQNPERGLPKQIGDGVYTYSSEDGRTQGVSGAFGALLVTKGENGRFSMTYTHNTLAVKAGGQPSGVAAGEVGDAQNYDFVREGDDDGYGRELGADEMQVEEDGQEDEYGRELDENDMRTWEFDADAEDQSEVDTEVEGDESPAAGDEPSTPGRTTPELGSIREPGDDGDEDDGYDADSGFYVGDDPKGGQGGGTATETKRKPKAVSKKSEIGRMIHEAAEEYGVDPGDLNEAIDSLYDMHRERLERREKAKSDFRKWHGITQRDINRLENQGKDWNAIKGFDVIARAAATAFPEIGIGIGYVEGGKEDADYEENLWNALKEGVRKPPTRRELVSEAAEWLAQNNRDRDREAATTREELEKVPFRRDLRDYFVARYGQRRLFDDMGSTGGKQKGFEFDSLAPMTDAAGHLHAPKGGATVNGKDFEGGEFIPAGDVAAASDEEKQELKEKQVENLAESMKKASGQGSGKSSTNLFGDEVREKPKPEKFENTEKTKQPRMFSGMDSLPGQEDLFEGMDQVNGGSDDESSEDGDSEDDPGRLPWETDEDSQRMSDVLDQAEKAKNLTMDDVNKHLSNGGKVVIVSATKPIMIDSSHMKKWNDAGRPLLRQDTSGKGFRMASGSGDVFIPGEQVMLVDGFANPGDAEASEPEDSDDGAPWQMTAEEWKEQGGDDRDHAMILTNALREGKPVPDHVINSSPDGRWKALKSVFDWQATLSSEQMRLRSAKPTELTEREFLEKQRLGRIAAYLSEIPQREAELSKLGPKQAKRKQEVESSLEWSRAELDRYRSMGHGADDSNKNAASWRKIYAETIREGISKGLITDPKIIDQRPEFKTARTARQRYEKGRHTSFANKSIAVDSSMKAERGYKAKRQDGKDMTDSHRKAVDAAVSEVEKVLGPMKDIFDHTDLTIAHTSGKHPFLSTAGGLYSPSERTVTIGHSSIFGETKSLAHELAHWLDYEAGAVIGARGRVYNASFKGHDVSAISVAEQRSGDWSRVLQNATRTMNNTAEVKRLVSGKIAPNATEEEKAKADVYRVHLGHYWRQPHEIFARLAEQYISDSLSGSARHSADADYSKQPGWWSEKDFAEYRPVIKAEIERRIKIIRDAAAARKQEASQ